MTGLVNSLRAEKAAVCRGQFPGQARSNQLQTRTGGKRKAVTKEALSRAEVTKALLCIVRGSGFSVTCFYTLSGLLSVLGWAGEGTAGGNKRKLAPSLDASLQVQSFSTI